MAAAVTAIGVISGLLGIFQFGADMFEQEDGPSNAFDFRIGLDGALPPSGTEGGPLEEAGGDIPDIRCFNEVGNFLAITADPGFCENGSEACNAKVETDNACSYSLFTSNNNAVCIGWMSITFPGGDRYANTIGNWASTCADRGAPATWYYSDVLVQVEGQGAVTVNCAWMDADGDQPITGIQLHWPEFRPEDGETAPGQNEDYYCANNPALRFLTEPDPNSIIFIPGKRDMFSRDPSTAMSYGPSPAEKQRRSVEHMRKRLAGDTRLIKTHNPEHTATKLCDAPTSVGPNLVSYEERMFCEMEAKKTYPFCEDVESGACWDDVQDAVVGKGNLTARDIIPRAVAYSKTITWEKH